MVAVQRTQANVHFAEDHLGTENDFHLGTENNREKLHFNDADRSSAGREQVDGL